MRRFDVFADFTVDVDYRYGSRFQRRFARLLYIFANGLIIHILVAGNGAARARSNSLLTRTGIYGRCGIFKHLIPNILPQIMTAMTLSLGSMILYESTLSYLTLGVQPPFASWGTMIEIISKRTDILQNNFNVWGPAGICIIIAVLGFNFIGDGLRDALDPKQRR